MTKFSQCSQNIFQCTTNYVQRTDIFSMYRYSMREAWKNLHFFRRTLLSLLYETTCVVFGGKSLYNLLFWCKDYFVRFAVPLGSSYITYAQVVRKVIWFQVRHVAARHWRLTALSNIRQSWRHMSNLLNEYLKKSKRISSQKQFQLKACMITVNIGWTEYVQSELKPIRMGCMPFKISDRATYKEIRSSEWSGRTNSRLSLPKPNVQRQW